MVTIMYQDNTKRKWKKQKDTIWLVRQL